MIAYRYGRRVLLANEGPAEQHDQPLYTRDEWLAGAPADGDGQRLTQRRKR